MEGRDLSSQGRFRRGDIESSIGSGDEIGEILEGRVEICHENVWSAIYDENWSNKDAAVACHQLELSRVRFQQGAIHPDIGIGDEIRERDQGYRYGMLLEVYFYFCTFNHT